MSSKHPWERTFPPPLGRNETKGKSHWLHVEFENDFR